MRLPLAIALLALTLLPARPSADLLIVEKSVVRSGDRVIEGVRSTSIKGTRMRVEVVQEGQTAVTIYDLPAGETIALVNAKQRAEVRGIVARNAKLEKEYPRARVTTSVTAAGSTRNVAGISCDDHAFAVRVPMTSSGEVALRLTGTACLAVAAPGAADYMTFATAARNQNLVLGPSSDNYIVLAVTRGQTELYRALTEKGGIPLIVDFTSAVDGTGMVAGIARKSIKAIAAARLTTAARVEATDSADALFAVPAGWKRENKK